MIGFSLDITLHRNGKVKLDLHAAERGAKRSMQKARGQVGRRDKGRRNIGHDARIRGEILAEVHPNAESSQRVRAAHTSPVWRYQN